MLYLPKIKRFFPIQISTALQRLPLSTVPIASSSIVCVIATMVHRNPSRQSHGVPIITPTKTPIKRLPSFELYDFLALLFMVTICIVALKA